MHKSGYNKIVRAADISIADKTDFAKPRGRFFRTFAKVPVTESAVRQDINATTNPMEIVFRKTIIYSLGPMELRISSIISKKPNIEIPSNLTATNPASKATPINETVKQNMLMETARTRGTTR